MASALAQQLQQLQVQRGATKRVKGKPSLLFDWQKAADLDVEALYEIGLQGFGELCRLNPRFTALREALFSRAAASVSRDQQQPDGIAKLDAAVDEFCGLLTGHFLSPAAFKALEYLIRRFRVNEHNINSLIMAGLPYHATNEFVLLIQTLQLDPKRGLWGWLAPAQVSGASLPREVLVQRCLNDPALLTWLCETACKLSAPPAGPSKAFLSFYAVTLCEVITEMKAVGETELSSLLPWLSAGLEAGAAADYRAASLMMVASLTSRVTLGKDMVKALANSILRSHNPDSSEPHSDLTMLMVLAHVARTQPHLNTLSEKALKALLAIPSLNKHLEKLHGANVRLTPLLRLMTQSLASKLSSKPQEYNTALQDLIMSGVLGQVAEALVTKLLHQGSQPEANAELVEATQQLLRALDLHYPTETDRAVNALLAQHTKQANKKQATEAEDDESEPSEDDAEEEQANGHVAPSDAASRVFELVQSAFAHTARARCGDTSMTLAAAAMAPAAGVRRMALEKMSELLLSDQLAEEQRAQVITTVINGLQDDELEVVAAVLGLPCLPTLPLAALLPALLPPLTRTTSTLYSPTTPSHTIKQARTAFRHALQLLSSLQTAVSEGTLACSDTSKAELHDLLVLLILQATLPARHALQATKAALKCAASLDHPLFASISEVTHLLAGLEGDVTTEGDEAAGSKKGSGKSKKKSAVETDAVPSNKWELKKAKAAQREEAAGKLEQAVVEAVAKAVARSPATLGAELLRLSSVAQQLGSSSGAGFLRAQHVMLLALQTAVSRAGKARKKDSAADAEHALAQQLLALALQQLSSFSHAHAAVDWQDLVGGCLAGGLPQAGHAVELHERPQQLHHATLCAAMLAALESLPAAGTAGHSTAVTLDLNDVFKQVATLQPAGGVYDTHLQLLLHKSLPQPRQQQAFLASLYCVPEEGIQLPEQQVRIAALRMAEQAASALGSSAHTATPIKERASGKGSAAPAATMADSVQAVVSHTPHLLAVACSSDASVRAAAMSVLAALSAACGRLTGPAAVTALGSFLGALQPHGKWIGSSATALTTLLQPTFNQQTVSHGSSAPAAPSTPARGKKAAASNRPSFDGQPAAHLSVEPSRCLETAKLLASLLPGLHVYPHDLVAARTLMQCLSPSTSQEGSGAAASQELLNVTLPAAAQLLHAIFKSGSGKQARLLSVEQQQVAALAVALVYGKHAAGLPARQLAPAGVDLDALFLDILACAPADAVTTTVASSTSNAGWYASTELVRLAALQTLANGDLPSVLSETTTPQGDLVSMVIRALAMSAAGDASAPCRHAARAALEAMPVAAEHVTPVLLAARTTSTPAAAVSSPGPSAAPTDKKKRRKSVAAQQQEAAAAQAAETTIVLPPPGALEQAVLLLEMLQWKQVVSGGEVEVVTASQQLLSSLQPTMSSIVQSSSAGQQQANIMDVDGQQQDEDETAETIEAVQPGAQAISSLAGYAAQLILSVLESTAKHAAGEHPAVGQEQTKASGKKAASSKAAPQPGHAQLLDAFDFELAVSVAQAAPDAMVRNAALALLTQLASLSPKRALKHVLQVLALVNASTAASDDQHSQQVATTALAAVVPAWVSDGQPLARLWQPIVHALSQLPSHRRLPLLVTMYHAAQDHPEALPTGLLQLLVEVVAAQERRVAARKAAKQQQADEAGDDASQDESEWLLELAASLALQAPLAERLHAFAALLKQAVAAAEEQAHVPLARLAVSFIAAQLKLKAVVSGALDHQQDESLLPGCEDLMNQALACVQLLAAAQQQAGAAADSKAARKLERAIRTSIKGLYALFEALQAVMAPHSYLQALMRLAEQQNDKVQRRALRLFGDRAAHLPADLQRISQHPAYGKQAKESAIQRLATSALQICTTVTQLTPTSAEAPEKVAGKKKKQAAATETTASALTQQAALLALSHVAAAFGPTHAGQVCGVIPQVLTFMQHDSSAVRGSAMTAVAAAVRACGTQLLPQLPSMAKEVLIACEAAATLLPTAGGSMPAAPQTAGKRGKARQADSEVEGSDQEGDDDGQSAAQLAAVELAAGLAAVSSMVTTLGPFLSPYLPSLLRVLLLPSILSCSMAGCADMAAAVRGNLPKSVPARLLLEPLFAALPAAMQFGLASLQSLLQCVTSAVEGMEASVAATHGDAVFAFLLKALDVRSTAPAALVGDQHAAESAAISALVALTLKLSEVKFKPMFLRLLEWASLPAAGGVGSTSTGRLTTLFAAASALVERLRSVFVPYFRHLLDVAIRQLSDASGKKSKKRKQEEAVVSPGKDTGVDSWVLRATIMRALHRCFLYDSVSWTDQDKVDRLLPVLVAQLEQQPPAPAAQAVAVQCADAELDAGVMSSLTATLGSETTSRINTQDVYGRAAVGSLVLLAVAANTDLAWKPLNRAVLMTTRAGSPHTRQLALEVVAALVDRLREEYLTLLPETLPFLAELLEDPERQVEARAQAVLRTLESVSGESLGQYLKTS